MSYKTLQEIITSFKAEGLAVVRTLNKAPIVARWEQLPDNLTRWAGNLTTATEAGFVISDNYLVVDVDPRNFKNGNALERLSADLKIDLLATAGLVTKTASGGYHLYFLKGTDKKAPNENKNYAGVEFKQRGQQVLLPLSVLPDGRKYELVKGSVKDITMIPPIFWEVIGSKTSTAVKEGVGFVDSPADINRVRKLLEKMPPAIEGSNGDAHTFKVCCLGKDYGLSPSVFFDLLMDWNEACQPAWSLEDLHRKMLNAYSYSHNTAGSHSIENLFNAAETEFLTPLQAKKQEAELVDWKDELQHNKTGGLKTTLKNAVLLIKHGETLKEKLAYNEFSGDKVWLSSVHWHHLESEKTYLPNGRMWTDIDAIETRFLLNNDAFDVGTNLIYEAVTKVCNSQSYHPVKQWLERNNNWDKTERLSSFFSKYCGADNNVYSSEVAKKMFCGIVARVFDPGCKFDYLPIFVGKQGMCKSTLLKVLSIHPSWFCDNIGDITNAKEMIPQTRGKLIVEWQELALFSKIDINHSKSFLSTSIDRVREAYHREAKDYPRQFIVVATTNQDKFLLDETGNRRMLPIELREIDVKGVRDVLPQLYAEAIHLYRNGEKLYIENDEANAIAERIRFDRFRNDELEETVLEWLDNIPEELKHTISPEKLQVNDIIIHCLKESPTKSRGVANRIGNILRRVGYTSQSYRENGRVKYGFVKI